MEKTPGKYDIWNNRNNISFAAGEKQRCSSQSRLSRPVCKYTRNQNLVIFYTEKQQQRDSARLCLLTASNRKEEPASIRLTSSQWTCGVDTPARLTFSCSLDSTKLKHRETAISCLSWRYSKRHFGTLPSSFNRQHFVTIV